MVEYYRGVIEVLKWLEPKSVLKGAAGVSTLWARVADSEELWASHIEAEELEELVDENLQTMKAKFRDAIEYAHIDRFVTISEGKVRVFQFTTETFLNEFISPPKVFNRSSAIAILSKKELFACGGWNRNAYLFSMADGTVTPLPSMFDSRVFLSALFCYRRVYVFGGLYNSSVLQSAECFGLKEKTWGRLPDMINKRYSFNAYHRDKKVYLCGGDTNACEVFDIDSLHYTNLAFLLPKEGWTVSFFYENQLAVIIEDKIYFFENAGWREGNVEIRYPPNATSTALVYGHLIYILVDFCNGIIKVDMNARRDFDVLGIENEVPLEEII